jgi:hypothetical protein
MQVRAANAAGGYPDASLARPGYRVEALLRRQSFAARRKNHRVHITCILS